jgi:hypothetical protein
MNFTQILAGNVLYGPYNVSHWWGRPAEGYYCLSRNDALLARHATQLRDMGVDFVFVDVTNHAYNSNALNDRPSPRYIPFDQICEGLAQCEINKIVAPAHEHRAKARSIREANDGAIPGVCHLAGCLDSEFSYDASFNGKPNGAMTHFAIEAYKQLPPGSTYQQWIDLLQTKLPDRLGRYPQHPQLTATAAELRRVIVGKEIAKPEPPPVPAAGPGPVDLVVGVWRAKHIEWERA